MVKKESIELQLRKQLEEIITTIYKNWKNPERVYIADITFIITFKRFLFQNN
ncbi:MAG: hypothetical protein PVF58_07950 [Candidatus Methanofastidiosia archaeon]|jgi:hypothetical protein